MPGEQGLRGDDRGDLRQQLPSQAFGLGGQAPALTVGDLFTRAEGKGPVKRNGLTAAIDAASVPPTVLVSQDADRTSIANAEAVAPLRFRTMPSIAYRLALVAAGEAQVAVSLNCPVGWDYAGGHALLLGAGMDLYDSGSRPIRYSEVGDSSCGRGCFGGAELVSRDTVNRIWIRVLSPGIES